jgi:hypothetical protein
MFEAHTRATNVSKSLHAVSGYTWGTPRRTHGPESETGQYNNRYFIGHTKERQGEIFFEEWSKKGPPQQTCRTKN